MDGSIMTNFENAMLTTLGPESMLMSEDQSVLVRQSADFKNLQSVGASYLSPHDSAQLNIMQSFQEVPESSNQTAPEEEESKGNVTMNEGLSILQKLQQEGLFNFKNVPEKKKRPQSTAISTTGFNLK